MFSADYKWQHDYVRLAFDTGFRFERHKSDNFDKNRISSIDLDRVVEDRDFATIEKFIPCVTKFVLDSEQAQLLDESFVKTFRLSQLSIQYLLYCKKYLDNTVILVKDEVKKLKEENKELNLFVEDLKGHIETLMKEIDEKPVFRCNQCDKAFSTEEFLSSHIKRRHTLIVEAETDKLQMEIKELKGRLNNAEKMIQKEQDVDANFSKDTELRKIEDLQQKFEDLRLQVQSELKILQSQHNFQEKWFEKFVSGSDLRRRRESTTQTDLGSDSQAVTPTYKFDEKDKENIPEISDTQKQMAEFGEALETKVTSSLQKIENQMQSFWNKLSDMERYRVKNEDLEKPKPAVKARKKFTLVELVKSEDTTVTKESLESESRKSESETNSEEIAATGKKHSPVRVVATQLKKSPFKVQTSKSLESTDHEDEDTITSETIVSEAEIADSPEEEQEEEEETPPKPKPIPRKRPHSSDKKSYIDEELLKHFRVTVENIIMARIQDLGVSPDWKGLPTRSFNRAMEIVNHQATLTKKTYPNFDFISSQIEKTVTKKVEETKTKRLKKVIKAKPQKAEPKKEKSPKIEIKNRKMYDTDSDTDSKPQARDNLGEFSAPYSAVIEELKAVTSKLDTKELPKEDQTKGVLKSYPSVGSLTKKKVLFNLNTDEDDEEDEKKDVSFKDGGSSTSITSSVFDATPRKEDKKKDKEKDIEDLSDFDFSDM